MKFTLSKAYQSVFVVYIHRAVQLFPLLSHFSTFLPLKSNFRHLISIHSSPFIPPASPSQPMGYFPSL